ncbi:hypothetical protein TNCV_4375451 [Trichonephila clavipes]|uniref:Uncharacterized protein n=1 Tax=Trichonephila clavipes TaxID=2585209 RepID=A0A8X6W2A3_TRICX|nr:hypothetical protein TNCV_4375451 [Trichonephila clavipes]
MRLGNQIEIVPHLSSSPDLTPTDFLLFPKLKNSWICQRSVKTKCCHSSNGTMVFVENCRTLYGCYSESQQTLGNNPYILDCDYIKP